MKLSRADELPLPRLRDIEVSCDASDTTTSRKYNIMIRRADADEMGRLAFKIDHVPCSTKSISCTVRTPLHWWLCQVFSRLNDLGDLCEKPFQAQFDLGDLCRLDMRGRKSSITAPSINILCGQVLIF